MQSGAACLDFRVLGGRGTLPSQQGCDTSSPLDFRVRGMEVSPRTSQRLSTTSAQTAAARWPWQPENENDLKDKCVGKYIFVSARNIAGNIMRFAERQRDKRLHLFSRWRGGCIMFPS